MSELNINPIHNGFQNAGSTSTHTSLTSPYSISDKGFQDFQNAGSTSTHSSLKSSGFQYLLDNRSFEEDVAVLDTLFVAITKVFEEDISVIDGYFTGYLYGSDPIPVLDSLFVAITKTFEELISVVDSDVVSSYKAFEDDVAVLDSLFVSITKVFEELVFPSDTLDAIFWYDTIDSTLIEIEGIYDISDTVSIGVDVNYDITDSVDIAIIPNNLAAVVNASSTSNIWLPTIIIGGNTYVTNPTSAPPLGYVVTGDTYFIDWSPIVISGIPICDIISTSCSLDYMGGSFTTLSDVAGSGLGLSINYGGFAGTVTEYGRQIGSSENYYFSQGIFGPPNMNKQLNLLATSNDSLYRILSTQKLSQSQSSNWMTYSQVARAIASAGGATLAWNYPDLPYNETFSQEGSTALEALASLVAQIGATLRWDGATGYNVCRPNFSSGVWQVPHERLINSISTRNELDLRYGIAGVGLFTIPVLNQFDSSTQTVPGTGTGGGSSPSVMEVASFKDIVFDSEDSSLYKDLPSDMFEGYIQILVSGSGAGSGNAATVASRYVTQDDSEWFNIGGPSISNQFITIRQIGGDYRPQFRLDSTVLPNLDLINNGKYWLKIGVTKTSLGGDFQLARDERDANIKNTLARTINQYTYVPIYRSTVSCKFFGSIPLPGMTFPAITFCGETFDGGIIESVSFNLKTKELVLQVVNYAKINFITRLADLNTGNTP